MVSGARHKLAPSQISAIYYHLTVWAQARWSRPRWPKSPPLMTSLTKNPHPATKIIFFESRLEYLPSLLSLWTALYHFRRSSKTDHWSESLFQTLTPLLLKTFWIRVQMRVQKFFKFENPTSVQTPVTIINPTLIFPCFYLRNGHTDSCYCRNWKVTPDPGPVFHKFLTVCSDPCPTEKTQNPAIRYDLWRKATCDPFFWRENLENYRCQSKFLTCEISDFTPCTHAQSNILLQPLRWRYVESVIHHERDVRDEQQ